MAGVECTAPETSRFLWNNVVCFLEVKDNILSLCCLKKLNVLNPRSLSSFNKSFSLLHVISVDYKTSEWKLNGKGDSLLKSDITNLWLGNATSCFSLNLSISVKTKNNLRKFRTFKLQTCDEKACVDWCQWIKFNVKETIQKFSYSRPKSLLIFVNPYGGKKKAETIYRNTVSPLFALAEIQETLVVTKYQNHARDYVESNDLSQYDGIIAVGGDGMLNEIVNGILVKTQKQHNVDVNTSDALAYNQLKFVKAEMRIGVIPAGSTNCLSYVSQGVDDPETSALHIICGESHPLDICSIHDNCGKLIRFSFSMTSYGYMGNVLRRSENLRTLGPSRYDFAGIHSFFNLRSYPSEVTYLPSSPETPVNVKDDKSKCRHPCAVCSGNESRDTQLYRQMSVGANTSEYNGNVYREKRSLSYPFFSALSTCVPSSEAFNIGLNRNDSIDSNVQSDPIVPFSDEVNVLEERDSNVTSLQNDTTPASPSNESTIAFKRSESGSSDANDTSITSVDSDYNQTNKDSKSDGNDTSFNKEEWKVSRGNFMMINSALMSCACARCPEGLSPSAHLADGNVDLILLRDVSRADFLMYLLSHTGKANRFDFPFVEVHRVKAFHYRILQENDKAYATTQSSIRRNSASVKSNLATIEKSQAKPLSSRSSCWNSDGEIIEDPNISLWVHRGLINLFARGIEES